SRSSSLELSTDNGKRGCLQKRPTQEYFRKALPPDLSENALFGIGKPFPFWKKTSDRKTIAALRESTVLTIIRTKNYGRPRLSVRFFSITFRGEL
ncbi:MAG: hypothetical protein ABJQ14_12920, partial [Hyphomicrobiales bacterium]